MGRSRNPAITLIQKNLYRLLGPDIKASLSKIEKDGEVSISTVSKWLNGSKEPSLDALKKVANCIGFRWSEVFNQYEESELTPKQKEVIRLIPYVTNESLLNGILSIIDSQLIDKK